MSTGGTMGTGEVEFCGSATVGARGQVAIPAALRRELGLDAGDQVIFVRRRGDVAGFQVCLPEHTLRGVLPAPLPAAGAQTKVLPRRPVSPSLLERVKATDLFAGLAPAVQAYVASLLKEEHYARGEVIAREGEPCTALYSLVSGRAKRFKVSADGKEQILKVLLPGDSFNEVPVMDGGPNPATAQALEDCVVYALGRGDFLRALGEVPGLAEGLVQVLSSRLRHLVGLVEDLSFRNIIGRVARLLLEEADVTSRLTQQEMASMVGTVREVVGRALHELEQMGAIAMDRGHIRVVNPALLRKLG